VGTLTFTGLVSSNTSPRSVLLLSPNEQTVMVNTLQIVICPQKNENGIGGLMRYDLTVVVVASVYPY
jgi:hypothetical protein